MCANLRAFIFSLILLHQFCAIAQAQQRTVKDTMVIIGAGYDDDGINLPDDVVGLRRSSNGKVWSQYLGERLNINRVLNYALHGAFTDINNMFEPGWGGNQWQVDQYLRTTPRIPATVLIGAASGAINEMFTNPHTDQVFSNMVRNFTNQLQRLINAGATSLFVLNLPDYTLTPFTRNPNNSFNSTVINDVKTSVANHNQKLSAALTQMSTANPTVTIVQIDFFRYWNEAILGQPAQYQYANFVPNSNGETPLPNMNPADMPRYAFFDESHPSTLTHYNFAANFQRDIQAAGILTPSTTTTSATNPCTSPSVAQTDLTTNQPVQCLGTVTCAANYRCRYSTTQRSYYCCSATATGAAAGTSGSYGCPYGNAYLYPGTLSSLACTPGGLPCPTGHNCVQSTVTNSFQCCSF